MTFAVMRLARDLALLLLLARHSLAGYRRGGRVGLRTCCLLGALALYAAVTLLFGREGVVDVGYARTQLVSLGGLAFAFVALRFSFRLGSKTAMLEALVFVMCLRVPQSLFESLTLLVPEGTRLYAFVCDPWGEYLAVTALGVLAVLALTPPPDGLDESSVSPLHIALMVFVLTYYFFIRQTSQVGPTLVWGVLADVFQRVCLLLMCLVTERLAVEAHRRDEARRMSELVEGQYQSILQRQRTDEQLRRLFHDVRHVLAMVRERDLEADERVRSLEESMPHLHSTPYTGNAILNMLLNQVADTTRERGIRFDVRPNIGACDFLDDYDCTAIFGNLLTNAIESTERMERESDRWICFEAVQRDGLVLFRISNPCEVTVEHRGTWFSTKRRDPAHHGYGIDSVRGIVQKYQGSVQVDAQDGLFVVCVALPIPERDDRGGA